MTDLWRRLGPIIFHPAAIVLVCLIGAYIAYEMENTSETMPFVLALMGMVACLIFLISNRAASSIYVGLMIVGLATAISAMKFKMKGFSLHGYDAVFFAQDGDVVQFLLDSYLHLIVPVVAALIVIIAAIWLMLRTDARSSWHLRTRVLLVAVAGMSLINSYPVEAGKERFLYYMQGRHVSAFFISLLDLGDLAAAERIEARLQNLPRQRPFAVATECGPAGKRPDVFVVLSESQIDPAIFPQIADGQDFLKRYAPGAGPAKPLNVETFGGGTWITNLSLMAGLSAADFGWKSPYLTMTLQNRVDGALPGIMAGCGYRTVALLPMKHGFVNEGPFLESIGFETILDLDAIKAPTYHMRDNFYFEAAEAFVEEHRRTDGRPLFLEIQTMFPHSPYNERREPDVIVAGEPFAEDPETSEYLRRAAMGRIDFQAFLDKRAANDSGRGSVVLEFGDHQSFVTKPLVDALADENALARPGSLAYRTFYTVTAFGAAQTKSLPDEPIDIAYLGAAFFEAASLPTSPMMRDLLRLRDHCKGAFAGCNDRSAIDLHLRRRADSGLLLLDDAGQAEAIATQ